MQVRYALTEEAKARGIEPPERAHAGEDAGFDLRSLEDIEILPGAQSYVPTGVHFEISPDLFGLVCSRTSVAREGLIPIYQVVDSGFTGELVLRLYNTRSDRPVVISAGDRVAQVVFLPFWAGQLEEAPMDEWAPTRRGEGREGSSGRK